ncbi:MAG: hypothetical protein MJA83_20385 [Gammaproteobacteria bacterium]|nr:hypothetical protein [Gammaproteobacteria bacterium]
MVKQAVIFIHGVGNQSAGYSNETVDLIESYTQKYLNKALEKQTVEETRIVYREVFWAPITARAQKNLWARMSRGHDLDLTKLRRFIIDFAGDALSYYKQNEKGVYEQIHNTIDAEIQLIFDEFPEDQIEFTIVGHSLGSVVASNYLYDCSDKLTATNFFTLGSPIAIWLLNEGDVSKPNCPVQVQRPQGIWVNILDDEDIVGCPLRNVNRHYRKAVDKDVVTEIGGLTKLGPLSHVGYWKDKYVINSIARKLAMDYLRINNNIPFNRQSYLKSLDSRWSL